MSDFADVRAFNRFYTRQLGLLNEHVARSSYSLSEGRVLYEMARLGETSAIALVQLLDIDAAYLSRILRRLIRSGLVATAPVETDRRRTALSLTDAGHDAVRTLDELNNEAVVALLARVDDGQRRTLVQAMSQIRRLLGDEGLAQGPIVLRGPRMGELGWLTYRNGVLYNQQFGWDQGFEALVAGIYREFHELPDAPAKQLWIAERDDKVLGSVFVIPFEGSAETAQLRMLYVEPEARGQGIGALLVKQAVRFARDSGYRGMRLWTQQNLVSARRIYAAEGFAMVSSEPHHSFGKDLVSEFWEISF